MFYPKILGKVTEAQINASISPFHLVKDLNISFVLLFQKPMLSPSSPSVTFKHKEPSKPKLRLHAICLSEAIDTCKEKYGPSKFQHK